MDWLWILAVCIVIFLGVQIIRLAIADCDLSLQWAEKFGVKPESLRGKVVWITGSSSGIGEYLAYELASAGCRLVLSARREAELKRVKQGCIEKHGSQESDILILPMDMVKFEEHQQAVDTVLKYFKKIDILVNNAGRSQRAEWEKIHLDVDRQILELNVMSVISLTRCVLPHMMDKKEGHIVVTSSVAGKLGVPGSASYTGSKHALHGYFEALRIEAADRGITVTMLCPGPVFSNLLETAFTETPGKNLGGKMDVTKEKRMPTKRCAKLCVAAIANKVQEAWIVSEPTLIFFYLSQYFPNLGRWIGMKVGMKIVQKIREGKM
ncbi:hypothetical protein CHS0354_004339 [Potamilus streckersoni]|uniref:Dehydrogenase/reductase SDR family member 7 n=1 Tax=Potamilus streckersoni TaxID=2493646 RepID=A0AAE0SFW7_9BIVA|nr:hypothetical protein CHS0354_004339 [Potamilus streckersoni]